MAAQEILKMIETVSPDDTARLDEIDARVTAFKNGLTFLGATVHGPDEDPYYVCAEHHNPLPVHGRYTRSRDALKAIRPEGWSISIQSFAEFSRCSITFEMRPHVADCNYVCETAPNEELAELHAIIQVIEYERSR